MILLSILLSQILGYGTWRSEYDRFVATSTGQSVSVGFVKLTEDNRQSAITDIEIDFSYNASSTPLVAG